MVYRHGKTRFEIAVENPNGVSRGVRSMHLDGVELQEKRVCLVDDGGTHQVTVIMGKEAAA
jgi:cyclic beta-1,2-glucan synthetase